MYFFRFLPLMANKEFTKSLYELEKAITKQLTSDPGVSHHDQMMESSLISCPCQNIYVVKKLVDERDAMLSYCIEYETVVL